MRLGVLARAGIVASALWMIGYSYHYADARFTISAKIAEDARNVCDETNRLDRESGGSAAIRDCEKEWTDTYNLFSKDTWSEGISAAAFYLVIAWIVIAIAYGLIRWILAGRKNIRKPD